MAKRIEFTSTMSRRELLTCLLYLPVHAFGMPVLANTLYSNGLLTAAQANVLVYAVGAVFILTALWDFFKREFYSLCDRPGTCILTAALSYFAMMGFNLCPSLLLYYAAGGMNPNTEAVAGLSRTDMSSTAAMSVFMAPILEEPIFRGAIFGGLRRKSRFAACAVSMVLFGVYHVWGYAIEDPIMWIYVIQYLPVSFLLCLCYERTDSIWTSILFHMVVNGISVAAIGYLGELL